MTPEQLDKIDRLLAEKVMGWKERIAIGMPYWSDAPPFNSDSPVGCGGGQGWARSVEEWKPTRDIAQAWEVLEKFKNTGFEIRFIDFNGEWHVDINPNIYIASDTAPLAICLACLKAKGIDVE